VPLTWYESSTFAFFGDETHATIRRCYTSPNDQSSKRYFCGFCGTPLSYWSEEPPSEADYISLTLGSLAGSDLQDLEELGLLPKEATEDAENDKEVIEKAVTDVKGGDVEASEALPWFETMVEGSRLGKMKKMRGTRRSGNGRMTVEWEIVEWTDDNEERENDAAQQAGKRKLGDVGEDDPMEH